MAEPILNVVEVPTAIRLSLLNEAREEQECSRVLIEGLIQTRISECVIGHRNPENICRALRFRAFIILALRPEIRILGKSGCCLTPSYACS